MCDLRHLVLLVWLTAVYWDPVWPGIRRCAGDPSTSVLLVGMHPWSHLGRPALAPRHTEGQLPSWQACAQRVDRWRLCATGSRTFPGGTLTVAGGSLQLEGPAQEPVWTTVAEDAPVGSTLLQLAQAANWQVGPTAVPPCASPFSTCLARQLVPCGGPALCDTVRWTLP